MSLQVSKVLLNLVFCLDAGLVIGALLLMYRNRATRQMPYFAGFLGVAGAQFAVNIGVMFHRQQLGLSKPLACQIYYYTGWVGQIAGSVLIFLSIYSIYRSLMSPLPGLQRIGGLMFRWVGGVAVCLACLVVFGPHATGSSLYLTLCNQFHEGVAILTLVLLLAISFATRPLGLSIRSRLFGTTLGLGVLSVTTLVEGPWLTTSLAQSPYSPVHLIGGFGCLAAATIWTVYFALPEPERRIITLPTTSPFFFWNRIAEALGDAPGEVAVSGLSPRMFAPAELLALTATPRQPAPVVEMPKIAQR